MTTAAQYQVRPWCRPSTELPETEIGRAKPADRIALLETRWLEEEEPALVLAAVSDPRTTPLARGNKTHLLLARSAGRIVGLAWLQRCERGKAKGGWCLCEIAVEPQLRRHRLGTRLIQACRKAVRRHDGVIAACVSQSNLPAVALLFRSGFSELCRHRELPASCPVRGACIQLMLEPDRP